MEIYLKRAFDDAAVADGYRVLVDRLWPRGVAKQDAAIDAWPKAIAPSDELRQRFHAGELDWADFRRRYLADLKACREELRDVLTSAGRGPLTLVFASKDERHNNAVVVRQYLRMLKA
ncbi:DUF488 domain-containing protein [Halomonas sp. V046]|uniref:DUF488 domain-containing protein n=1 Tax=Halomonas sp. V046 TaxID=3459611 RepID=UPI0040442FBF